MRLVLALVVAGSVCQSLGHLVIWCNGEIRLAKASDRAYEEVALIQIPDAEQRDAYTIPSYANGHFHVRNSSKIAAVKVSRQ